MAKVVTLPVSASQDAGADEHARAETQRKQRLFDWADAVLEQLGLVRAVAAARSIVELRTITFNMDSPAVDLAIRDALHPASGDRAEHFRGLREGSLRRILANRFVDMKREREAALRGGSQADWTDDLILDKKGKIKPVLANLVLILREGPAWKGVLAYNEFSARVVIKGSPPLERTAPGSPWTDHHESQARVWFQRQDISPSLGDVGRAVQTVARFAPFHPVRDFLGALVWDGVPRVESWLRDYFHVADSEYVRAVGPRYLVSAVARVYAPGCKVDHMLVLEGPQGKQKSEALRTLAVNDDWYTDRLSHVGTKDAAIETAGVWIVELSEMDAMTRATASATKSYLTRRSDRFRPPYAKHLVNLPRQCVFAGTINPPVGGYLKDATGSRRVWPIACRGVIDRAGLERVRDQLWAEAVHLYKAGMPWWLQTPELEALATAEQAARFAVDAWEEPVREWLGDRLDVTLWEVLEGALGLDPRYWSQSVQQRVTGILTRMGFEKCRPRTPKGREYRYRRDPPRKKNTC